MHSMTGYGNGIAEDADRKITVELKSVNHRYLDLYTKMPRVLMFAEDTVRNVISKHITRGHIDVFVQYEDNRQEKEQIKIDIDIAKKYKESADLIEKLGVKNDLSVSDILSYEGVVSLVSLEDDKNKIIQLLIIALEKALDGLVSMRAAEGANLLVDIKNKVFALEKVLDKIKERVPSVNEIYEERLREKVKSSLNGSDIDESRVTQEVALFIDKSNIDEEITRLSGHLIHYTQILKESGSLGKRLDFLTQETYRETNTIGSKINDLVIINYVLEMKNIIEMIREQVQNIE